MDAFFEGRTSDSPYIQMVWRGHVKRDYSPVCPADANWNLLFAWEKGQVKVSAEGPTTHFVPKTQVAGNEFLVIKFRLGVFFPYLPADQLVNDDAILPQATRQSFWLNGSRWQLPTYDNAEIFVDWLVRDGTLIHDPVVDDTLAGRDAALSARTVRRRFVQATGLTPKTIQQIRRAQQAVTLLEQGAPISEVAFQTGYADQPHLTRSLKRYVGQTPGEIAGVSRVQG